MTRPVLDTLIGIGDIHGNYAALHNLLESLDVRYHLFDDAGLRSGAAIEFNGDFIDRGPESLRVLETVKDLCDNNFFVNAKPGNHELLALQDLDVARKIRDEIHQNPDFEEHAMDAYKRTLHGLNGGTTFVENFGQSPKDAFDNYVRDMSSSGVLGYWLRALPAHALAEIADQKVLFTHADVPSSLDAISDISVLYEQHMRRDSLGFSNGTQDKYNVHSTLIHSLFWERRFEHLMPGEAKALAQKLGVDHIVVGHTPQRDGILNIEDTIFNIDVGMYAGNDPAAIVFERDGITAHYINRGEEKLLDF